jgi:serine/threonine protein phosphatase 1
MTYVVPDIHGRLDLLELCLSEIAADAHQGTVIFTGDYIDRGPESCAVVQRMIDGPPSGWKWVHIRGNHEDMMLECITGNNLDWWIANGGGTTLASYGRGDDVSQAHLAWMNQLPRLHHDAHRVYTHAGIDESAELDDQPEQVTQWFRYPNGANVGYRGKHLVHGHTPQQDGPELYENRTNLDTGGFFTGRMVVGVFDDDLAGGPLRILEVSA